MPYWIKFRINCSLVWFSTYKVQNGESSTKVLVQNDDLSTKTLEQNGKSRTQILVQNGNL